MSPPFQWTSQVVVVTGASAGIGAALCREVGRRGASVVLAARRAAELEEVAAASGQSTAAIVTDVTVRSQVERLAQAAVERFGHVDVWVNNAGRGITRSVLELTDDDLDVMLRDNVKSMLYGVQAIAPHFRARRAGHVINVSSMLGRIPFAGFRSAYCAAKHALCSLTENLRTDLAAEAPELRVSCVYPGVVYTDFGKNAVGGGIDSRAIPGGQTPEEVATVIAGAIESRNSGDVYTRHDAVDRVLQYYRGLAAPAGP